MKKKLFSGFIASMFSISILSSIFIHTSMVQAIELTNDNSSITTSTEETSDKITLSTTHPTETTITTIKTTTVTTAPKKFDEKNTALEKLAIKERRLVGKFERERAVLLGELDSDATRLTINDVQNIIDNSDSFNEIWQKLKEAQPYPDYYGGSGITNIEYWFDDRGEQKIMLIKPQEDILYVNCTEDGTVNEWEMLYTTDNQIDYAKAQILLVNTYLIYNDIDDNIVTTQTTKPVTLVTTTTTTNNLLTEEQNKALEELAIKERQLVGKFERERAVLYGEIKADAARLSIDEVKNIIDNSDSFNEIWQKLKEAQPYPDYYGGSGITNIEYWFDDRGEQKIMLIKPQEDILYVNCTEDGTVKDWDKIYSKGNNVDFIQYQSIMIDSFIIYNDITLKNPLISVEDILLLSKKHDELSWSDFENYDYSDIGDGSYIWEFNIKDSSSKLLIGGKDFREKPDYIILSMRTGVEVDVRKDDLTPWFYDDSSSIKGDTNCDGTVDMADAVLIMQALANPNKYGINGTADHHLTEQGKLNGDMDGDGLTVGDAQEIQKELLGLK